MSLPDTPHLPIPSKPSDMLVRSLTPVAVTLVVALLAKFGLERVLGNFYSRLAMDVGIAIILVVSLNIVNGFTGQFSLGHAGFMAIGGYTAGAMTYYGSLLMWGNASIHGGWLGSGELLMVASCLVGGLVAAGAGFLVGLPTLRLKGDYLAIATLGFGEIVRVLLQQTGPTLTSDEALKSATWKQILHFPVGGALGFNGIPKYTSLFWVVLLVGATLILVFRLKQSSTGRALVSVREDEIAAQAMGINVTRMKVNAFVYSAFFAGIAGGLYAHERATIIGPDDAGFQRSIELVIMVVFGGMGSISGVTLAATVLTPLLELLRDFKTYRLIVYALMLILVMILRPQGLFGFREIWDYFPKRRKPVALPKGTP